MSANGLVANLVSFFKTARHLWGRCPECDAYFRLSDVAISSSANPPKDWLRRLEREKAVLLRKGEALDDREADLEDRDSELDDRQSELDDKANELDDFEDDIRRRELRLDKDAHTRVQEILRNKTELRSLIAKERKAAVQTSRATLLGKLMERIAPCFRTFDYDPRDMRCIADPFDYVLFDGLTVERQVRQIAFIEVKCGKSVMSPAQRSIRDAVAIHRVFAEVWNVGTPKIPITRQFRLPDGK
jgi:predicted Holliday junction resolvase-like endonuclease